MRDTSGKRTRRFFPSKRDAALWKSEVEDATRARGEEDAQKLIGDLGRDAVAAADVLAQLPEPPTLTECARFYVSVKAQRERSEPVRDALLSAAEDREKAGAAAAYVSDMRAKAKRFAAFLPAGTTAADVTTDDARRFLETVEGTATTRANFRRTLAVCFNHAIARGVAERNPFNQLTRIKEPRKRVECWTPGELITLFRLAGSHRTRCWIALGAFAGIRSEEIGRMDWSMIDLDAGTITLPGEITKTKADREIRITDNLQSWLRSFEGNRRNLFYGQKPSSHSEIRRLSAEAKAAGLEWIRNGLRHGYASHHVALHRNPGETALQLGHEGSVAMLHRHYKGLVSESDARQWFAITPAVLDKKTLVSMEVAG